MARMVQIAAQFLRCLSQILGEFGLHGICSFRDEEFDSQNTTDRAMNTLSWKKGSLESITTGFINNIKL